MTDKRDFSKYDLQHGLILRSTVSHAELTGFDVPRLDKGFLLITAQDLVTSNEDGESVDNNYIEFLDGKFPIFASNEITYKGQPLLALFGPDFESVEIALSKVKPIVKKLDDITPEPFIEPLEHTYGKEDPLVLDNLDKLRKTESTFRFRSTIFANPYRYTTYAWMGDGTVNVTTPCQWEEPIKNNISRITGIKKENVKIENSKHFSKRDEYLLTPILFSTLAAYAASATGLTARMRCIARSPRPKYTVKKTTYFNDSGHMVYETADMSVDQGAFPMASHELQRQAMAGLIPLYNVDRFKGTVTILKSNLPPASFSGDLGFTEASAASSVHLTRLPEKNTKTPAQFLDYNKVEKESFNSIRPFINLKEHMDLYKPKSDEEKVDQVKFIKFGDEEDESVIIDYDERRKKAEERLEALYEELKKSEEREREAKTPAIDKSKEIKAEGNGHEEETSDEIRAKIQSLKQEEDEKKRKRITDEEVTRLLEISAYNRKWMSNSLIRQDKRLTGYLKGVGFAASIGIAGFSSSLVRGSHFEAKLTYSDRSVVLNTSNCYLRDLENWANAIVSTLNPTKPGDAGTILIRNSYGMVSDSGPDTLNRLNSHIPYQIRNNMPILKEKRENEIKEALDKEKKTQDDDKPSRIKVPPTSISIPIEDPSYPSEFRTSGFGAEVIEMNIPHHSYKPVVTGIWAMLYLENISNYSEVKESIKRYILLTLEECGAEIKEDCTIHLRIFGERKESSIVTSAISITKSITMGAFVNALSQATGSSSPSLPTSSVHVERLVHGRKDED